MINVSVIKYDSLNNDFLIDGRSLLQNLRLHEKVDPNSYIPAFLGQPDTIYRLINKAQPDLKDNHVAIYLCSHCGGYDGNPIGVKVTFSDNHVIWSNIGYYEDYDEGFSIPFKKITSFTFEINQYIDFLEKLKIYEI